MRLYLLEGELLYCGQCGPEDEVPDHGGLATASDCCCEEGSTSCVPDCAGYCQAGTLQGPFDSEEDAAAACAGGGNPPCGDDTCDDFGTGCYDTIECNGEWWCYQCTTES